MHIYKHKVDNKGRQVYSVTHAALNCNVTGSYDLNESTCGVITTSTAKNMNNVTCKKCRRLLKEKR